ncbi:hypothetical protein Rt10032_c11g4539 [Rhodotorula toruloides]|uniref:Uncharacterized protein n=1 Tax=Rhodotorula toruloides TaxID=5286 RepID=A0A511KJG5_RHOTO|nr:hypothetical protein Rt10032_c11g4539 [Rhodotorula toruloides]
MKDPSEPFWSMSRRSFVCCACTDPSSVSVHPDLRDEWATLPNAVEHFVSKDPARREYNHPTRALTLFPNLAVTRNPDWPAVQRALVALFDAEEAGDKVGIEGSVFDAPYIGAVLEKTLVPADHSCVRAVKVWLRRSPVNQPNEVASPPPAIRGASLATLAAENDIKLAHHQSAKPGAPLHSGLCSPTPFSTPEPYAEDAQGLLRIAGAPPPAPKPAVKLELDAYSPSPSPDAEDNKPPVSPSPARKKRKTAKTAQNGTQAPPTSAAQYFASIFKDLHALHGVNLEPGAPLRDTRLAALDCAFKRTATDGPKCWAMNAGMRKKQYAKSRNFVAVWPENNVCAPEPFACGNAIAILASEDKLNQYLEVITPGFAKPVDAPEGVQVFLRREVKGKAWWQYKGWAQVAYDGRAASTGFKLPAGRGAFDSLHPDLWTALSKRTAGDKITSLEDWGFKRGGDGCITVDSMRRDLECGKAGFFVRFLLLRFVKFGREVFDGWDEARRRTIS